MATGAEAFWLQSAVKPIAVDSSIRLPLRRPRFASTAAQDNGVSEAGSRKPSITSLERSKKEELSGAKGLDHETSVFPNSFEEVNTTEPDVPTALDLNENDIPLCG